MFKKPILFCCVVLPLTLLGQHLQFIDSVLNKRIIYIPAYQISTTGNESILLKMNFAKPEIIDTTGIYQLYDAQILSVDLVFTDYPFTNNLKPLNKKRIQNLIALLPFITKQNFVNWQLIRQTDGKDERSSAQLLHGFIINYRRVVTNAFVTKELNHIKTIINELPKPKPVEEAPVVKKTEPPKKIKYWDVIYGNGETGNNEMVIHPRYLYGRMIKQINGKRSNESFAKGDTMLVYSVKDPIAQRVLLKDEKKKFEKNDSVYVLLVPPPKQVAEPKARTDESVYATVPVKPLFDSTVVKILLRNKFKQALVVVDVTASMAEYTGQLLNWLSIQNQNKKASFISCFNDGDDMLNERKQIGNTGGIYGEPFVSIDQAGKLIEMVMSKGSGGDLQENDCEALIKSISMCADCNQVILIADNWAPVRDIVLVKQIKQPVHVIVCGGNIGINPEYITIAYNTNGTLHFKNEDVVDFTALQQGKEMPIRGKYYKLNALGRVVEAVTPH